MNTTPTFTTKEVVSVTGASQRQIQWWDEKGIITPRQQRHKRTYTFEEVLAIMLITILRRKGLSIQRIRAVIRKVRNGTRSEHAYVLLTSDGRTVWLCDSAEDVVTYMVDAKKPLLLVDMRDCMRKIEAFQV